MMALGLAWKVHSALPRRFTAPGAALSYYGHNSSRSSIVKAATSPRHSKILFATTMSTIQHRHQHITRRTNFTYAGPRKLSEIMKLSLLNDMSPSEITDIWQTYHDDKEQVHGLSVDSVKGRSILARAAQCPFFIHPLFRDAGHFMLLSQYQSPNYFLFAYLEDYRSDPINAKPLLTISIFNDMAETKGVALVRCDIINRGIHENEGLRICKYLLNDYAQDTEFKIVHTFNKLPDAFDYDAFVLEKERRWKEEKV